MSVRVPFLVCCLLAGLLVVACSDEPGSDENGAFSLTIGVVHSLSGPGSAYGPSAVEGIELALDEFREQYPDWSIEHTVIDDQSTPAVGMEAYRELVAEGVDVLVGPSLSTIGFEVLEYAQEQSIPVVAPITTAAGISAIGDYIFRIALSEDVSLPALVERVSQEAPLQSAVLFFHSGDAYSRSAAEAMRHGMIEVGGTISHEFDLASGSDLQVLLDDPAVRDTDGYLLALLTDQAGGLLRMLWAAGNQKPVLGGEALATVEIAELVGDATDGMYVSTTWHPDVTIPRSREFVDAYRARFGHEPQHFAAAGHAGMYVFFDALQRAGSTDPQALRDALAETADLDTVLGSLSMSDGGDAIFQPVFQRFEGGRLVILP